MYAPIKMKQVLLLTDGCSNAGVSPVAAALAVKRRGITVNVIGIAGQRSLNRTAVTEIRQTAAAGDGLSCIVSTADLTASVQMITQQSACLSIQQEVASVVQQRFGGTGALTDLHPKLRGPVVQWIEEFQALSTIHVLVLVDMSASMHSKLPVVKKALQDIYVHLRSRRVRNKVSVYTFPAASGDSPISRQFAWTNDVERLHNGLHLAKSGGITPTGPALLAAVDAFKSTHGVPDYAV